MNPLDIFLLCFSAVFTATGFFLRKSVKKKLNTSKTPQKKLRFIKRLSAVILLAGSWMFTVELLKMLFGKSEDKQFEVLISPERWNVLGHSLSSTIIVTWCIMALLIIIALIIRLFFIPKFTDKPKGIQNALEIMVESIDKYTVANAPRAGLNLGSYIFTIAVFMISCAAVELLGIRAPTADLTMTAAMALITFVLINYYGIRIKGFGGRIRSLAAPTALVFPIRLICEFAIPVSLACRLFGNMLGGLIVMDLLYYALGSGAVGIPSVIGLYFNVFHPLIQAFIFVTLTLAFINEASETQDVK